MRYKQIFSIVLLCAASILAHASLYANAGGGVTEGSYNYNLKGTPQEQYPGELNGMGQVAIGFVQQWGNFSGGLEVGYEWQGFDATNEVTVTLLSTGTSQTSTFFTRLKNDYYVMLKPGYVVKDAFIFYGLLGIMRGNFTYNDVSGDLGTSPGADQSTTQTGFRAGLGISNKVKQHWEWRAEYSYNGYASIESSVFDVNQNADLHFTRSNITMSQVLLGVGYHF